MSGLVKDWRGESPKNPDAWLAAAPDFSRPICTQLREWFFRWEPDLRESIKWGSLCFSGRKLVCGIGAFKKHTGISFFRGTELRDSAGLFHGGESNTNLRAIRITTLEGFNREALRKLLRAAVELDARPDILPLPPVKRDPWPVPDFFTEALRKNKAACVAFERLSPSCQREYLVWLSTAKRPETRERRLKETLAALAAGRKWAQRKLI